MQVKIYEWNHTGEKPFNCTKRGKSFSGSKYKKVPSEDPWRNKLKKSQELFPHHYSWQESQWREAIQVHKVWHELFIIKRLQEMIRGSMKETTIEGHQIWQELFHIRWRRESHWREAIQLHKVWQELLRIKILKKVPSEDPWRKQPLKCT